MKVKNGNVVVEKSWIVPYSPLLSKTFKTHCNVEYCNSIKSIKYVSKYVTKGSDMAVFGIVYSTDALGRIYTVHTSNDECLYPRLLLVNVPEPTSFEFL